MAINSKTNVRELMGHSHSHAHGHSHDTTLLTGNKNDAGVRITRIGLYVNIGMAVSKGLGGYMFNSKAYVLLGVYRPYVSRLTVNLVSQPMRFTRLQTSSPILPL